MTETAIVVLLTSHRKRWYLQTLLSCNKIFGYLLFLLILLTSVIILWIKLNYNVLIIYSLTFGETSSVEPHPLGSLKDRQICMLNGSQFHY